MLRKTVIGVSFFAFLGLCLISFSDRSAAGDFPNGIIQEPGFDV
jgi:hypothetical protein